MKRILIALDFDPSAKKVAEKGYSLAKAMNAEVTLVHVIADATYYSSLEASPIMGFGEFNSADFLQYVNAEGVTKASEYFLDKLKHHLGDKTIQTVVEQGGFAESILKTAKHYHSDIIVMGSHSKRWLEQILLGSVTAEVLKLSAIPLYIIPIKEHNS